MKSRMYQIYELKDEIPVGISNAKQLREKELAFINIIKESGRYEEFSFMLEHLENEIKQLDDQISKMEYRLPLIQSLIDDYEKQDDNSKIIDSAITRLLEGIGAVAEEHSKE